MSQLSKYGALTNTLPLHKVLERSAFLVFPYSPNGMKLKFVDAALPHNCWASYLCATPNFGKIGAQAATPPSLPTKEFFMKPLLLS